MLLMASGMATAEQPISGIDEHPSMELLEFLGGFETPEGEWLDPMMLAEKRESRQEEVVEDDD
jgi:squalene cyclase